MPNTLSLGLSVEDTRPNSYMPPLTQARLILHRSLDSPQTVVAHGPSQLRSQGIINPTANSQNLSTEEDLSKYIYICSYIHMKYIFIPFLSLKVQTGSYKQAYQFCKIRWKEDLMLPFSCVSQRNIRMVSDSHDSSISEFQKILNGFLSLPTHQKGKQ